MKDLKNKELVIFDVETTGLSPKDGDRIIEIAALKLRRLKPVDRFHTLINPEREISREAFEINGISQEMLEGKPTAREVLPGFLDFIGSLPLAGHNISFDLGFLRHELSLLRLELNEDRPIIDTIRMAKTLLPGLKRYPLWLVAQTLKIDVGQVHRAAGDVDLTAQVLCKLLDVADKAALPVVGQDKKKTEPYEERPERSLF